ncbi:hypothetical protein EKO27_g10468 [Xylaria grammica]|uniref:Uncharacterized protein n=1 Tax=Xylaria grammica TaxID=363999 RepID=A0A439CR47_9PEZI|nr:hypothetical protein EKO27_g10468 [Xylaria grammica]
MSSFFSVPGAQKKRKRDNDGASGKRSTRPRPTTKPQAALKKRVERGDDDEITSGSDSGFDPAEAPTPIRQNQMKDKDMIAARLEDDVAESKGKVFRHIASDIDLDSRPTMFRDNTHTVTSVALCSPFIYLVTKDSQLIKYRLQPPRDEQYKQTTRKKPKKQAPPRKRPQRLASVKGRHTRAGDKNFKGHVGQILCVAASDDGKYVVTGGDDKRIVVWDSSLKPLRVFTHHRDSVTGLVFRRNSHQMYSCSKDRTIRVWNCDALAFVESLFGHADSALDVDALALERLISVGARDRTVRRELHPTACSLSGSDRNHTYTAALYSLKQFCYIRSPHEADTDVLLVWKVADETQLVFRATSGTGDKKKQIDLGVDPNSLAATGSLDRVAWTLSKKKPLDTIARAHGLEDPLHPSVASSEEHPSAKVVPPPQPRGITSLRALPYSDLILSGSTDGFIVSTGISCLDLRVWKFDEKQKRIESVGILGQPSKEIASDDLVRQMPADAMEISDEGEGRTGDTGDTDYTSTAKAEPCQIKGVVNDIAIISRGKAGDNETFSVVCAIGKEHRLGRWGSNIKGAKNGAVVFELRKRPRTGEAKSVMNGTEKVPNAK